MPARCLLVGRSGCVPSLGSLERFACKVGEPVRSKLATALPEKVAGRIVLPGFGGGRKRRALDGEVERFLATPQPSSSLHFREARPAHVRLARAKPLRPLEVVREVAE